jgi:hypothetical protein
MKSGLYFVQDMVTRLLMPRNHLAGQQAAGVGFGRPHGQAVGRQLRSGPADARGQFEFGQGHGLLAGRQAAGVGFVQRHSQAVGRRLGRGPTDAQGPFEGGQRRVLLAGR